MLLLPPFSLYSCLHKEPQFPTVPFLQVGEERLSQGCQGEQVQGIHWLLVMTRILQYTIILYFTLVSMVTGGYIIVQWNLA